MAAPGGGVSAFASSSMFGGQSDPMSWQTSDQTMTAQQASLAQLLGLPGGGGLPFLGAMSGAAAAAAAAVPGMMPGQSGSFPGSTMVTMTNDDFGDADGNGNRSAAQQERNRQAQQRYRERKKAKQAELEWTVKQLQQQATAMQAMQQRTQILEGMNSELHSQLAEKQREAERLKRALCEAAEQRAAAEGATCCAGPHHSGACCVGEAPGGNGADASHSGSASGQDGSHHRTATVTSGGSADLRSGLRAQTAELRAFLAEHNLDGTDITGNVSDEVMSKAAHLVCRGRHLCLATEHVEGPGMAPSASEVDWESMLTAMALTPEQRESVLRARSEHLEELRAIYAERQTLNMQAMALMLPSAGGCAGPDCCAEGAARRSTELESCLDRVKANLRRETQSVLDFKGHVVSRILTPIQAARYMVAAHPHHCDVLALCNALAREVERDAPAPPTAAPAALQ